MAPGGHIQLLTGLFGGPVKVNLWEMFMRDITLAIGIPNSKTHIPVVLEQVRCGHIHPERRVTVHDWTEVSDTPFFSDIWPVVVRPTIVNPVAKPAKLILPASD